MVFMSQSLCHSIASEKSMGKRSNFERNPRDYYPTPIEAVEPLVHHLPYEFDYVEPCAGDGRLISHITKLTEGTGKCLFAGDIEPRSGIVKKMDALNVNITPELAKAISLVITNPPWERKFLHAFIAKWIQVSPLWLLFDADWMHTKQSAITMTYCRKVVSVGRVRWIEGSKHTGKDNCAWYYFEANPANKLKPTEFYGRMV